MGQWDDSNEGETSSGLSEIEQMQLDAVLLETAYDMGFSIMTLNLWRNKYPDLEKAVNIGTSLSEAWWQKKGRENITNIYFNQALWMMNMANRYGWSRRTDGKEETILENELERYEHKKEIHETQAYQGGIDSSEVEEIFAIIQESKATEEIQVKNDASSESKNNTKIAGVTIKMDKLHPKRKNTNTKTKGVSPSK